MPVTGLKSKEEISQRDQYAIPGVGRDYWDYRDRVVFEYIKGDAIFEGGCGEGVTLEKLVKFQPKKSVVGLDVDPRNVEICSKYGLPVQQGSLFDLPFEDESFDTCLFLEVIEHLETPEAALREFFRVLKREGRLIVVFPYDFNFMVARLVCLRWREACFDPHHVKQWRMGELVRVCEELGFRKVAARMLPLPFFPLHGVYVGEKILHSK